MELRIDPDVQAVIEYMQNHVPTTKLAAVADAVPKLARLLWNRFPQEPFVEMGLVDGPIRNDLQRDATESGLGLQCAGDGSAGAVGIH